MTKNKASPTGTQGRKLRRLADATAKLWDELDYARLVQFRETGRVDFRAAEGEFYHKYKNVLGVSAGQAINLDNSAWRPYFELRKMYEQGLLPKFTTKPVAAGLLEGQVAGEEGAEDSGAERPLLHRAR
jgi:hypothetical protein